MTALKLARQYAGLAAIDVEILAALAELDLVRSGVRNTIDNLQNGDDRENVLEALSVVKRFLEKNRDVARSEQNKIRNQLEQLEH
ncbi:hypothetical protein E1A40_08745 [Salmonella enterica subsp. enterica serovar Aba]|nr:hypothetical protein [Salmonella enterica subsp. enterica serovar Aba]EBY6260749.1 hypothetical protein [Salmonella enterica subsp. enterica serovar Warnow]ECG5317594.1 hypothetical protein [Salmonella enterica subsp. enterica serovar Aba]